MRREERSIPAFKSYVCDSTVALICEYSDQLQLTVVYIYATLLADLFDIFKYVFYTIYLFREVVTSNIALTKLSLYVNYLIQYNTR